MTHPQRQGLQESEFLGALDDPSVVKTTVEIEGESVELPQLGPVGQFEWLNVSRYEREFPQESAKGELVHYIDLPGVEPGPEVKERLLQSARNGGVLVFDYPLTESEYESRVKATLDSLGIKQGETQQLAMQTYFAGQIRMKDQSDLRDDPKTFADAYQEMIEDGSYDLSKVDSSVSLVRTVDQDEAISMNAFYEAAYEELNSEEFCNQGLSPEEFLHTMTEEDDSVKLIKRTNGEAVSLLILDNNLDRLSWINSSYYKDKYAEKYQAGQVMWFPGLAANPNKDPGFNAQRMITFLSKLAAKGGNEVLVVFDCGNINTGTLDAALNFMINKTPSTSIDIQPIAQQRYCAIKLSV
jgi:hypothetical protein